MHLVASRLQPGEGHTGREGRGKDGREGTEGEGKGKGGEEIGTGQSLAPFPDCTVNNSLIMQDHPKELRLNTAVRV